MKKCKKLKTTCRCIWIILFPAPIKKVVEEHLKSCPRCTKILVQLSKTQTLVNNLAEVEPPVWLKQKIMAKVREEAEKKSLSKNGFIHCG